MQLDIVSEDDESQTLFIFESMSSTDHDDSSIGEQSAHEANDLTPDLFSQKGIRNNR